MSLEPTVAGPQTDVSLAPESTPPVVPPVLSDEQRALLRAAQSHRASAWRGRPRVSTWSDARIDATFRSSRIAACSSMLGDHCDAAQRASASQSGRWDGRVRSLCGLRGARAASIFHRLVEHT
jgi:hypothetical protein